MIFTTFRFTSINKSIKYCTHNGVKCSKAFKLNKEDEKCKFDFPIPPNKFTTKIKIKNLKLLVINFRHLRLEIFETMVIKEY